MLSCNVIVLPEFATSTRVFREVIGASVKALKEMSSLGLWPHRLLCFAGLRTSGHQRPTSDRPLCAFGAGNFSFISAKAYDLGV